MVCVCYVIALHAIRTEQNFVSYFGVFSDKAVANCIWKGSQTHIRFDRNCEFMNQNYHQTVDIEVIYVPRLVHCLFFYISICVCM